MRLQVETNRPPRQPERNHEPLDVGAHVVLPELHVVGHSVGCRPSSEDLEDPAEQPVRRVAAGLGEREDELPVEVVARAAPRVPLDPLIPRAGENVDRVLLAVPDGAVQLAQSRLEVVDQASQWDHRCHRGNATRG
jgi:hypothetical protein